MLNLRIYESYNGETSIALLDNSSIEFLEKIERDGSNYAENLLKGYDVIFIPEWVLEEVTDSEFRSKFVEQITQAITVVLRRTIQQDLLQALTVCFVAVA